jgi:hypothetical protein
MKSSKSLPKHGPRCPGRRQAGWLRRSCSYFPQPADAAPHPLDALTDLVAIDRTGKQKQTGGDELFGVAGRRRCEPCTSERAGAFGSYVVAAVGDLGKLSDDCGFWVGLQSRASP